MSLTAKECDQMELSYENLKNNPKTLLAFTGFDMREFQILLKAFTIAWEKYVQQHRLPLEIRQRGYGGGRKSQLSTNEDKLLFILVYFKTYPLQEVIAFHFDISQGQACQWIQILSEVLLQTLTELGQLPERDPRKVKERLETYMNRSDLVPPSDGRTKHESDSENKPDSETSPREEIKESFAIDGTERRRQRPTDQEDQKRFYSGKKLHGKKQPDSHIR